ncbi:MAG: glycosyltransferase [Calditrichaeota bacterium]|nr:glycosyltransferase [Calditrichota bacterium]
MKSLFIGSQLAIIIVKFAAYHDLSNLLILLLVLVDFFLIYLLFKQYLSFRYKSIENIPENPLSVSVIIAFYNEDPKILKRCIQSVLDQTITVSQVFVYDDGSDSEVAYQTVTEYFQSERLHFNRNSKNKGKRYAQVQMLKQLEADIFVILDSDTILEKNAIEEGLKPFMDQTVFGVSGNISALNQNSGLVSNLYGNLLSKSFSYERAAQSVIDSVLVASGMFSLFRKDVIEGRYEHYLNLREDGLNLSADDKRLTTYAIEQGRVLLQSTAMAKTVIPEHSSKFLKQQVRWARGFFSETLYSLKIISKQRWAWWFSLFDIIMWLCLPLTIVFLVIVNPQTIILHLIFYELLYILLVLVGRSRNNMTISDSVLLPAMKLAHIFALFPIRLFAIFTLSSNTWLTRGSYLVKSESTPG